MLLKQFCPAGWSWG